MVDPALPSANAALFGWARRALADGRDDDAAAVAQAAARARPDEGAMVQLANVLTLAGHTAEARAALAPLAARDRSAAAAALVGVALREGRVDEAAALLRLHLEAHPSQRHIHYQLASVLPHLGDFDGANRHAARGTLIRCGDFELTSSRVIRFPDREPASAPALDPPFGRRVLHEPCAAPPGAEAIYVVGCDTRYFLLFGEALANSLARRAGARLALHFHLVP
jgi:tetratricopeptide (TPR) repeat protein